MDLNQKSLRLLVIIPLITLLPLIPLASSEILDNPFIEALIDMVLFIMGIKCLVFSIIILVRMFKNPEYRNILNYLIVIAAFMIMVFVIIRFNQFFNPFGSHNYSFQI